MFNSVVLDVFIGLVLIYLLYSLLITILGEMLSTWMGIRSRLLRVAIEKMLNDGYVDEFGQLKYTNKREVIKQFFLKEYADFKNSFAGKFYELPGIKYLVDTAGERKTFFTETKPSYLSATAFSEAMVQLLRDKGSGFDDMQKINFCLKFNTHHIQPQSLKRLRDIAHDADGDLQLFRTKLEAWYNETQDRTTGWYKRKMQVLLFTMGFIIAAFFNVDTIQIARKLSKDKNARAQMVTMAVELAKDSARYREFLNNKGESLAQAAIDSGWANVNNDIQDANYILGLGWKFSELTKSDVKEIAPEDVYTIYSILAVNTQIQNLLNNIKVTDKDSIKKALRTDLTKQLATRNTLLDSINRKLKSDFVQIDTPVKVISKEGTIYQVEGEVPFDTYDKVFYFIKHILPIKLSFWGLALTGLMLSLGAPFWFDLLKKLVAIRGAGVKPEEKDAVVITDSIQTNAAVTSNKKQEALPNKEAAELALQNLTHRLQDEPSVIAFAIDSASNPVTDLIVYAETAEAVDFLTAKYGTTETVHFKSFNIKYLLASLNEVHIGTLSGTIANKTINLGHGTLGCYLGKKADPGRYLLSCWHVLKDNAEWDKSILQKEIVDNNNTSIGTVVHGYLSDEDGVDAGIALCNEQNTPVNSSLPITSQFREVVAFDGAVRTKVKFRSRFKQSADAPIDAIIFHYLINARIKYPDGKFHIIKDVFTITVKDAAGNLKAPSKPGDSGAVVIDANTNTPLGMIIGGNDTFTYVIKFSNVFGKEKPYKEYFFITA